MSGGSSSELGVDVSVNRSDLGGIEGEGGRARSSSGGRKIISQA